MFDAGFWLPRLQPDLISKGYFVGLAQEQVQTEERDSPVCFTLTCYYRMHKKHKEEKSKTSTIFNGAQRKKYI